MRVLRTAGLLAMLCAAAPVYADDAKPAAAAQPAQAVTASQPPPGPDPFATPPPPGADADQELNLMGPAIRMLIALGVVLALIYITLKYGLRRLMGMSAMPLGRAIVSIVERVPLDAKRSLLVVKAAGDYLLVGTGDAGMSLIAKLDAETVERLQRERAAVAPPMSPFLQKLLSRRGGPTPPGPQGTPP